ncbi:SGNH/GDSL hydrolase family protein [Pseudomonas sp. No.21]|uniref:SGNH/GDSL hydrolase family protein n=1 Tax=Pseudomonas tohonis TaxID=2725477 RepID=UPI001F24E00C|nr:SGNH/GDSL hydrolase family protein [Pseudomonas tohonis]GJN47278.1 hypothetical protein TUM20249_32640 [Pseudomonas tohonis]
MSRGAALLWWASALALMPLVLPQALYTRRTALRLAPAAGPDQGLVGAEFAGEPLRILLIGESTVAGVGVSCLQLALPGQLAAALSRQLRRPVAWRACGENGITASEACERLLPQVQDEPVDLVLLVFGVNDTTHFSSTVAWRESLRRLAAPFMARGVEVVFAAVPPLQHFSALPWLLRRLLGWRARLLDMQVRALADELGAEHCAASIAMQADYLALDGYHPSQLGCSVWGGLLAEWIVRAGRVAPAASRLVEETAGA